MHAGLGEHRVVLNLGLAQRGAVVGDDHQLGLPGAERLEHGLVPEGVLAGPVKRGADRAGGSWSARASERAFGSVDAVAAGCRRGRQREPEKSGTRAHLMTIWRRLLMPSFCLPFFLDLGASAAAAGAAALALIVDGFYTAFLSV